MLLIRTVGEKKIKIKKKKKKKKKKRRRRRRRRKCIATGFHSISRPVCQIIDGLVKDHQDKTVSAAILFPVVCISDVMNKAGRFVKSQLAA